MNATPSKMNPKEALNYIKAGHGRATLVGREHRFTYKFGVPPEAKPDEPHIVFVSILSGSDNTKDYTYIGFINKDGNLVAGRKGRPDALSFKAIQWYLTKAQHQPDEALKAEFYHEGVCACCGRTLTTPESIERGFGPECWKRYS